MTNDDKDLKKLLENKGFDTEAIEDIFWCIKEATPQQPSEPLKELESDWEIQFDEKFGLKEKMRIYDNAKTAMEKIALKSGGLDFQISYLLCIKEWIRSKFGQPSECLCEDKKETIERRIERKNNNMDKKQFMDKFETFMIDKHAEQYQGLDDEMPDDYSEWLQSLSHDEVCEYIGEFSVLITSFKFPKKIDHKPLPFIVIPKDHELNDLIEHNREVGYNQAIDACIAAYEEAIPAQRDVRYPEKIKHEETCPLSFGNLCDCKLLSWQSVCPEHGNYGCTCGASKVNHAIDLMKKLNGG